MEPAPTDGTVDRAATRENAIPTEARAYQRPLPDPAWLGKPTEDILEPEALLEGTRATSNLRSEQIERSAATSQ
ncbi:MAG: hypothetical protein ACREDL_13020, partial [Bradyrhizobium sp.]